MNSFEQFINENRNSLNIYAKEYIKNLEIPELLKESIIYSLVNDGKKIRPLSFLYLLKFYNIDYKEYFDVALAVELVHTYSLVHDDLPEMDDDKFRRGVLSVYGKYGQSNAVLVGDELLNNANLIMFKAIKKLDNIQEIKNAVSASEIILNSSGINGMIYGQFLDLENKVEDLSDIEKINDLKTGELFKAAILSGAKLAGASDEDLLHLEIYAKNLGLVFQLQDDLFDFEEDVKLNKKTFATVLGKNEVEKKINDLNRISFEEINKISGNKDFFIDFIDFMAKRTY